MSIHAKLCFTGVQPLRIEERNLWTLLFIYSVSTSPVGWRLTRKISSIMPDTLIIMDYRRQFFMCLSLLMVSVIPEKGRFLNFSDDPLFSRLFWERQGGVKLWHPNGRKKPEKHMVTFTLSCTFLDPFTREKKSFSQKTCWIDYWFPISDLASGNCSGIIVGPKNNISRTADEWYANEEHSSR